MCTTTGNFLSIINNAAAKFHFRPTWGASFSQVGSDGSTLSASSCTDLR